MPLKQFGSEGKMWDALITLLSLLLVLWFLVVEPLLALRKKRSGNGDHAPDTNEREHDSPIRGGVSDTFEAFESAGNWQAEISAKEMGDEKFYARLLIIAAGIGAGYGKTKILKSLPGYSGDIHPRLSNMYEGIKESLEASPAWAKLRSKG